MKFVYLVLVFVIFSVVGGDPESAYCCKPYQGVLSDDASNCVNITDNGNITSPIKLSCKKVDIAPISIIDFIVSDDGKLILDMQDMETQEEPDVFCVQNETVSFIERVVVICSTVEETILHDSVLGYCMAVSSIFLTLTAIIYCALPKLRDLQGKSIINFCVSLALGLGILVIQKLIEYEDMNLCAARTFFVYLFILASFFWMNAISVQILLSIRRSNIAEYRWKPFLWYALYAWGIPIVLTICMAIVNYHPGRHVKPGIGLNTCWFYNTKQQWYYMYSVMMILLLSNLCIFFYISTHLCRHTFTSGHVRALRYKFMMTVRMFIVMGLPWMFEMISSLTTPHIVWVIFDVFNALQGSFIFLVLVVLRKRVIKGLYENGWLDCMSGVVERHLAVGDDEEDVVQHTIDVNLDERPM